MIGYKNIYQTREKKKKQPNKSDSLKKSPWLPTASSWLQIPHLVHRLRYLTNMQCSRDGSIYIYALTAQPYLTDVLNVITQYKDWFWHVPSPYHTQTQAFKQCLSWTQWPLECFSTAQTKSFMPFRMLELIQSGIYYSWGYAHFIKAQTYLPIPFRISQIIIRFFFSIV